MPELQGTTQEVAIAKVKAAADKVGPDATGYAVPGQARADGSSVRHV